MANKKCSNKINESIVITKDVKSIKGKKAKK